MGSSPPQDDSTICRRATRNPCWEKIANDFQDKVYNRVCKFGQQIFVPKTSVHKAFQQITAWLLLIIKFNEVNMMALLHKNSLASCQRYRHSVESCTLTCPFKQSNLSAWSLLSWNPTNTYLQGRLCFIRAVCSLLSRLRRVTRIMSTDAVLLNASLESFLPLTKW